MVTEELVIEEDGIPVFNPEAKLIKEFKILIERDKGSPGDSQGRKKLRATKELAFVALYVSLKSPYNRNFSEEDRIEELRRGLELPEDWEVDEIMEAAMRKYGQTQVTPSSAMLVSVRNGLYKCRSIVQMLEKRLNKTMEALMEADFVESVIEEEGKPSQVDRLMEKAMKDVESLLKYSKSITDQLETLETLEKKYVKEIEENKGKNKTIVNKHQL